MQPTLGQTYVSARDPALRISIKGVQAIGNEFFVVSIVTDDDTIVHEMDDEEWAALVEHYALIPVLR